MQLFSVQPPGALYLHFCLLYTSRRLVRWLRFVPLIIKRPIAYLIYGALSDAVFTTTFSNLGPVSYTHLVGSSSGSSCSGGWGLGVGEGLGSGGCWSC